MTPVIYNVFRLLNPSFSMTSCLTLQSRFCANQPFRWFRRVDFHTSLLICKCVSVTFGMSQLIWPCANFSFSDLQNCALFLGCPLPELQNCVAIPLFTFSELQTCPFFLARSMYELQNCREFRPRLCVMLAVAPFVLDS